MSSSLPAARSAPRTFKYRLWVLHRWLGLGAGLVILAVALSGGLLLLEDEIKATVESRDHVVAAPPAGTAPAKLNPALARLEERFPGQSVTVVYWPDDPAHAVEVVLRDAARSSMILATVNPWTAEIISAKPRLDTIRYWALQLHYKLLFGLPGMIATTLASVALTLLAVTGLWLHKRAFVSLLQAPMRLGRGTRLAWSDLHKWSGSLSLVLVFILGVTGVIYMVLILPGEIRARAAGQAGHQHGAARDVSVKWSQLPELGALRSAAKAALPTHEFSQLVFPGGRSPTFSANMLDRSAWWWDKRGTVKLDVRTGAVTEALAGPQRTAKDRALSALAGFHFGTLGASWVKWLYLLLGAVAPAVLSITGGVIWLVRTRKRARTRTTPSSLPSPVPSHP
jgi:uncharacterized iron-regulated membrane protein